MEERQGIVRRILNGLKTAVFEKGTLIYLLNIPSFRRSRRTIEARPRKERIRIGFIVQCPENWAVLQSIYEAAVKDDRTEPVILLMPELEFAFYIKLKHVLWEKTYAFGEKTFGNQAIRAYDPETGAWKDPVELKLDYVFIPRPYETYLPKAYRASSLRKTAKVCYVPYAFPTLSDWQILYNIHFIRNVSLIFCEKKSSETYVLQKLSRTVQSGDQKVFLAGYPKFDLIGGHEGQESARWPRKRESGIWRLLWTPRWTTDPKLGGSNFFRYQEQMIGWAEGDETIDLVFRPHPMALEHYIQAGLMTEQEQRDYLERYARCPNANVDRATEYYDTFYSSDCLITDISSMIMDYLFTGKPIIYCKSPEDANIAVPELHDCLYKADRFEEITELVQMLRMGKDPKKEKRAQLAGQLKPGGSAAAQILEEIRKDYDSRPFSQEPGGVNTH